MKVYTITIPPTYTNSNGLIFLNSQEIRSLVPFSVQYENIISIPPTMYGGNHKHPRLEAFITLCPDLEIIWQDENHLLHRENMMQENICKLFVVESTVPHAIINRSTTTAATLIEFADGPQVSVEPFDVLHK